MFRGKHAGGRYVEGPAVFRKDGVFIEDGIGLIQVLEGTLEKKVDGQWVVVTQKDVEKY